MAKELERVLSLNRKIGPFLTPPFANFVGSPMGAIPKKCSMPTKWRIINDLSWPAGHSISDGIPKELFSCTYDTIDHAISQLKLHGQGALMSKLDLSDACHILVRCEDWELLGSTWQIDINSTLTTAYFVNAFLPFGLPYSEPHGSAQRLTASTSQIVARLLSRNFMPLPWHSPCGLLS